jgi:hypothetical protein
MDIDVVAGVGGGSGWSWLGAGGGGVATVAGEVFVDRAGGVGDEFGC